MNTRLGLCSAYSFLYGVHKPEVLLERAASYGVKIISICDLNNLYGLHSFLESAKEKKIRPVIGTALTVKENPSSSSAGCLYAFVENRAGFARLCEILTARNKDAENFDPLPLVKENSFGLVFASSSTDVLKDLSGKVKHLFTAITPDDLSGLGLHKQLNLPLAFLDTSVFLDKSDYAVHKVLRAIALNKTIGSLPASGTVTEGKGILKTDAALRGLLNSWPQAISGTCKIAEICRFNEPFNGFIFPAYGENPCAELRQRVYKGASFRYGELGDMETDRIEYELEVIEKTGFASYFLCIDDIVKLAGEISGSRRTAGSFAGSTCGRGSGAASIVSYSLGITNIDPIAHNLYFERFLNPARPDPPDIDIDFAWDERDNMIKAVIERSGSDHCARVANHNFFRSRSALRETAKAYGVSDAAITQLERKLSLGGDLREIREDLLWNEIFSIAAKIEGLPRGLGMHCGGVVITPQPISRYAPIEKSLEGFPLLAWEKEGTEAAGFVKIDLLGNRSLAVIRDAVINISEDLGIKIEELENRLSRAVNDKETIEALSCGDSIGVFYIESPAMRQLQKKTKVGDFDHIVIHSSIIRPAANKFISEYVRRLKGGEWQPLHPLLDNILNESYGILCYQEDVSKTAIALAGFGENEADKLRKIIAKKAGAAKLAVYQKQFFEGCRKNKVDEKTIQEIWDMMLSFDGYSFCKPHSASYAMVSFQSAYLRVHYPAQFIAAVLSNQGGFYRPHAYIAEARRMRLITAGPDINLSQWRYYGSSEFGSGNTLARGTVVIGFMAIKGLSASGAAAVIKERERGGNFSSVENFSRRVKLSRDDIVSLCPAGVFDSIAEGLSRPHQARRLLSACAAGTRKDQEELFDTLPSVMQNYSYFSQKPLLAAQLPAHTGGRTTAGESFLSCTTRRGVSQISANKQDDADLWEEYNALGFLRNAHPLALWKNKISMVKNRVKAVNIDQYAGRNVKMIGWPVTQKDVWTKDGSTMCFLSLEDETGLFETVVFPKVYERYAKLLFCQQPLLVYGHTANDQGAVCVEVEKIEELKETAL